MEEEEEEEEPRLRSTGGCGFDSLLPGQGRARHTKYVVEVHNIYRYTL